MKVRYIIISLLIGLLLGSVGVYAALTYNANQITYTKGNNTMYLSDAIDELYTTESTTINNLNTELNQYKSRFDKLYGKFLASGRYSSTAGYRVDTYRNYYQFFKITGVSRTSGEGTCTLNLYNRFTTSNEDATVNTRYDTYSYNLVNVTSTPKSNESSRCDVTVEFYNE